MDLDGIRLLTRVVELGSVQRAAQLIGMSRSSLRRRLEELEAGVGSELFVRSAVGVVLTPAGAVVVEEGRALLERFAHMVASAKSKTREVFGRVIVVVPVGMPDVARVGLLRGLHAVSPGVCVEEIERAEPLDHLHEPFDLMFHFGEPPDRGQWFSRALFRSRLVPLASKAYLEEHGTPSSLADLSKHRLLSWNVGRSNPRAWPLWSGGSVDVEPVFCSRNGQLLHLAAQEGVGILLGNPDPTMLPTAIPLVPVLDQEIGREMIFRCLSPGPSEADPRARAVLDGIQKFLSTIAPEG